MHLMSGSFAPKHKNGSEVCCSLVAIEPTHDNVTSMLVEFKWRSLSDRCTDTQFCLFYKTFLHVLVAVPMPRYVVHPRVSTRHSKVKKTTKISNQYNQVPHLTKDIIWESGKTTKKHHTQENKRSVLSQQVNTKLQGADKTVLWRQT